MSLDKLFTSKLSSSALSTADSTKLHFRLLSGKEAASVDGLAPPKGGFLIPYFDLKGRTTSFWRYRYLESTKIGVDMLTTKKDMRYIQAPKTVNELYLPPLLPWERIASEPKIEVVFTEGELKAACATKHGVPTIGLGGVWCFKSVGSKLPLLPMFDNFNWQDRLVTICFDSDAASNSMVMQAEHALAKALTALGAKPRIARLPSLPDLKKTGLDDFIVSEGIEAFHLVMKDGVPWKEAEELFALNGEVVYVDDPGVILRLDTLQRIAPRAFVDHAYSTRTYQEAVFTADGGQKFVERSAPKEWLKWPLRASVDRVTYAPGAPRFTEGSLNVWKGWGCCPKKGSVKPWTQLLDFLVDPRHEPAARKWLEQWLAYPLQHPGTKLYTAVVIWGLIHGTGKSTVGYTMFRLYGANATEIADKDLITNFNEWAENKQFVLGDEITGGDKRASADRMKSMITQRQLRLNPKYIPSYTVPDCINYLFTSNHPDSFFLEDTDRRFAIFEVDKSPLPDTFYQSYLKWLDEDGGKQALFHHLLHLDLEGFNPSGHAPQTQAKAEMIETGRSDAATWVATLKESPDQILQLNGVPIQRALWTASELHALYDPEGKKRYTVNGISRELRKAGVVRAYHGMPVPCEDGSRKLWIIRNVDKLSKLNGPDLARIYAHERSAINGRKVKANKF